ncbi:MAG: nucleotide sugar dehydrogenase [Armatimonadetes bacterium]|nr:nucleotide sugar dehydrogenase [Armatimonadota bacterium]
MKKVCVVGLGYIGLPTAAMMAAKGFQVLGVDVDQSIVDTVNSGHVHIEEPGLVGLVRHVVSAGTLTAAIRPQWAHAYIIAVPTPVNADGSADLGAVRAAARSIAQVFKKGALVVLESTSPPRTTIDVVKPILEESGLKAGPDFYLAYSPERVLPGRIVEELRSNDRVVGGIDDPSTEAAARLYEQFVEGEIHRTTSSTAEMVKLIENTFRDVNIALANEFALVAEVVDVNVWQAIALANCHPRVNIHSPGPGVGGHCIAVDPFFLVEAAPDQAKIIALARQINDGMPAHTISGIQAAVRQGATIACLGLTFKPNVDDVRESPALQIAHTLNARGYRIRAHDPHVAPDGLDCFKTVEEAVDGADAVVLLVDHREYWQITPETLQRMAGRSIFDTRSCLDEQLFLDAGYEYRLLGAGSFISKRQLAAA